MFSLSLLIRWHRYCGHSLFFSFLDSFPFSLSLPGFRFHFWLNICLILNAQSYISYWMHYPIFHIFIINHLVFLWCGNKSLHWFESVDALHYLTDIFINASGNDTKPWMCDIGNNSPRCITCNAWWEVFASSCCG